MSQDAWDVVESGEEVTVADPSLRHLVTLKKSNGVHKVDLDISANKKDTISDGEADDEGMNGAKSLNSGLGAGELSDDSASDT